MIRRSFIFLERIDKKTEQNIWNQGIDDWDSFIGAQKIKGISIRRKLYYDRQLSAAKKALYNFNSEYFVNRLPKAETWRLYDFFKEDAVFLDIEATGITEKDDITVFGLFDGINTRTMIKDINLDYAAIKKELRRYKIIVTFNGSSFDMPFIKKRYPNLLPNIPHFDINSVAHRIGLRGGLKEIEKAFGIRRSSIISRLCHGDPLRLWRIYKATGDKYYLNLLVEYNEEDVINLKKIADYCVEKLTPS